MDLHRVSSEKNKGQVVEEVRGDAGWQRRPGELRLGLRVDPSGTCRGFLLAERPRPFVDLFVV